MSESHNKRAVIKLTPANKKWVDARVKKLRKVHGATHFTRSSVANDTLAEGARVMDKPNPAYVTSKR